MSPPPGPSLAALDDAAPRGQVRVLRLIKYYCVKFGQVGLCSAGQSIARHYALNPSPVLRLLQREGVA